MALNKGYMTAKTDKASDEVYTPAYAVKPLLKYLKNYNDPTIWCPFDTDDSEYVKVFKENNYKIIASHINEGKNFFEYEPKEHYDFIISNPPFSTKDAVIKRLYELDKPYAMLLPIPALQGQRRFPYMKDCQALIFDKRVNYYRDPSKTVLSNGACFGSFYLCRNFLPKDLIFEELDIKK